MLSWFIAGSAVGPYQVSSGGWGSGGSCYGAQVAERQTATGSMAGLLEQLPAVGANQQWPAGTGARQALPEARAVDYEFKDVSIADIEGWLEWIGVEIPVDVSGQLSGWVWGQRSDQGWFNFRNYRIEGAITSPLLSINEWWIDDAIVRFGYHDGVWYVGSLRGGVRADRDAPLLGRVELAARLPTAEGARIEVIGDITDANVGAIVATTDVAVPARGGGRLTLQASAPWDAAGDLKAWTAVSNLQLAEVQVADLPSAALEATAQLQAGAWELAAGELRWLPEPILISGSGRIDQTYPFEFALRGADIPLTPLLIDFELPVWARLFSGDVTLVASLSGDGNNGVNASSARLIAPALSAAGQAVEDFAVTADFDGQQLQVELAPLVLAQGQLAAVGRWSSPAKLASGFPSFVDVELDGFDLARLRRSLTAIERSTSDRAAFADELGESGWNIPLDLSGIASGNVRWSSPDQATHDGLPTADGQSAAADVAVSQLAKWRSSGDLQLLEFAGFGNRFTNLSVDWSKRLDDQQMMINLTVAEGGLNAELFLAFEDNAELELAHASPTGYAASGSLATFAFVLPEGTISRSDRSIPVEASGTFTAAGSVDNPLQRGRFELTNVRAQLARTPLQVQTALLSVTPEEFRLQRLQILDASGRVAGGMVWRRDTSGQHQFNLRLVDFQLADYAPLLLPVERIRTETIQTGARPSQPGPIAGAMNAELRLTKDAATSLWSSGWRGTIEGDINELVLSGTRVGTLNVGTEFKEGRAQVDLAGTVFGGEGSIETELPVAQVARFFGLEAEESIAPPRLVSVQTTVNAVTQETAQPAAATQPPPPSETKEAADTADANASAIQAATTEEQDAAPEQSAASVKPLRLNINWSNFSLTDVVRLLPDAVLAEVTAGLFAGPALETLEGTATVVGSIEIPIAGALTSGEIDLAAWFVDLQGSLRNLGIQQLSLGTVDFQVAIEQAWLDARLEGSLLAGPLLATIQTALDDPGRDAELGEEDEQGVAPERTPAVQLRWQAGELQRLAAFAAAVPWSPAIAGLLADYDLTTLAGSLSLDAEFERQGDPSSPFSGWQGVFSATTDQLLYRQTLIGDVVAQGNLREETLYATVNGELLGGEIDLSTELPGEMWEAISSGTEESTAADGPTVEDAAMGSDAGGLRPASIAGSWRGADLRRVGGLLLDPRTARALSGRLSIHTDSTWGPTAGLQGEAEISLPILTHGRNTLARQLVSRLQFAEESIRLLDLSGAVAGGRVRASGTLPGSLLTGQVAASRPGERLKFDAQRVDLNQLLQLLAPAYADEYAGFISYRGTVVLDRLILISGDVQATDGLVYGLPVQRGIGAVRVSLNRDLSLQQLSSTNLSGTAIGGDFFGEVRVAGGSRTRLTAVARVGNGKLDQLSRAVGFEHVVGTGRFNARLDLATRELFDLGELAGGLQIDFEGGDAQSLPILTALGRYVPVLTLASTDILGGRLRGRIGQGQLRISDFVLLGDAFWIAGEGSAGLLSGRLDLNAVIETGGRGLAANVGQAASRQLVSAALPQLMLINELNQLLSNRSLYLHIAGTTGSPVVQARVAPTLTRAVLRTVRQRLLVVPAVGATTDID